VETTIRLFALIAASISNEFAQAVVRHYRCSIAAIANMPMVGLLGPLRYWLSHVICVEDWVKSLCTSRVISFAFSMITIILSVIIGDIGLLAYRILHL